jgi:hypothetical protein
MYIRSKSCKVIFTPCLFQQITRKLDMRLSKQLESQSQSHFTADSQSVCLGVEATLWTSDQILLPFQEFGSGICCPLCGAPSLTTGRVCPL